MLNNIHSKQVCDLYTRGSHNRNISVILIAQKLFHQHRYWRAFSPIANNLVAMKNVRHKQFIAIARNAK